MRFPGQSEGAGWNWCVDSVTVAPNGDLEVLTSWTPTAWTGAINFLGIDKGADAGNRRMYLVDGRGRRYDHYETTEAARYGGKLEWNGRLQGTFSFRVPTPGSSRFAFHDDDQGVVVRIALDPLRRVSPEERAALAKRIRAADDIEIEDSWGGLGPARHDQWRLKRGPSGWSGDKNVSSQIVNEFFDLLAEAPLTRGTAPDSRILHTDDYPSLAIRLGGEQQAIEFSSESQGEGHVPWKLVTGNETLTVPSDHPERALALLRSVLKGEAPVPPRASRGSEDRADALRLAVQSGDVAKLRALAREGADVNSASGYDGATPLLVAVLAGRAEAIPVLAGAGARIDEKTPRGRPLVVALQTGRLEVVRALLAAGADPNAHPSEPAPLQMAVQSGDIGTVRAVLDAGAPASSAGTLTAAAYTGLVPIARQLVAKGASLEGEDEMGATPLIAAARHGHEEMLDFLLSSGAKVDGRSRYGTTALHAAAGNAQLGATERLLRAGASPNVKAGDGVTPLLFARSPRVVAALLRAGADPNAVGSGTTPLLATVAQFGGRRGYQGERYREGEPDDRLATVHLLVSAHANVNAADTHGQTPLMAAAQKCASDLEMIRVLLRAGADANRVDAEGRSALR
ncbi:MAG TPA: ankyrin repeat domain-containing protein, partial [Vicinamibacteria bacterium]